MPSHDWYTDYDEREQYQDEAREGMTALVLVTVMAVTLAAIFYF